MYENVQSIFPQLRKFESDFIVGTALNGVFLFAASTVSRYDVYFPKAWGTRRSPAGYSQIDVCLGTYEVEQTYRYHMYSPCILSDTLKDVSSLCSSANYPTCQSDPRKHSIAYMQ